MAEIPAPPARHAVLCLTGTDARAFLNGQCTQDILSLPAGDPVPAAVLTPQGRILAFGWVRITQDVVRFAIAADLAESLRAHLSRYVLRSKVRLTVDTIQQDDLPSALRTSATGRVSFLPAIRAGLPEVAAASSGEWIPQMLNLDVLGAIRFDKGCYTGQEIVARTQHLGRIKRRMNRYRMNGPAPDILAPLYAGEQKVGEVVVAADDESGGAECLAVITVDALSRSLTLADGRACDPLPLPYTLDQRA